MIIVQSQERASHGAGKGRGEIVRKRAPFLPGPREPCPLAALQPGMTLELELRSEGGASCSPKQCLVPGQEAQHPSGITGGSVGPLTHLIPGQTGPASEGGPGSSSFEGTCGGGCRRGSPSLLSQDGSQERCNCSITFHLITVLGSWVGPTLKKGQHTPGLAQQAVHLHRSLSPPTPAPRYKIHTPVLFPSRQPL